MIKVLFLLQDIPYPPSCGANTKVFNILRHLSRKGFQCDILCFGDGPVEERLAGLRREIPGLRIVGVVPPNKGFRKIALKTINLFKGLPPSLGEFSSELFLKKFQGLPGLRGYNVVHYDLINMVQYLPYGPDTPSLLSSSDAISLSYSRNAKETRNLFRKAYLIIAKRLIAGYERKEYIKFDRVHVVAPEDAGYLKRLSPGMPISMIPLVVSDAYLDTAENSRDNADTSRGLRICFTGNMDIPGIAHGLIDFLKKAYRNVLSSFPDIEFCVLGPKASLRVEKYIATFPSVKYFRWVEDFKALLQTADILLFLDKSGTGIKTRVLESMALGKPAVGTSLAFSGIDVINGTHCMICDTPAEMTAALRVLLTDPVKRETMGRAARQLIASRYSLSAVGPDYEALYAGLGTLRAGKLRADSFPPVYIGIPAYNAANTLPQTLDSLLAQTYPNIKIVVSDNASTDATYSIAEAYARRSGIISVFRQKVNIGAGGNFAWCAEHAEGKYSAIFHADDVYDRDMVRKQVELFESDPKVVVCATMAEGVDSKAKAVRSYKLPSDLAAMPLRTYDFTTLFKSILRNGNFLFCPSMMVRTEILKHHAGEYASPKYGPSRDLRMWLQLTSDGLLGIIEEPLLKYRLTGDSYSYHLARANTEPHDYLAILSEYIGGAAAGSLDNADLVNFEFLVMKDNVNRAFNHFMRGELEGGRSLLAGIFSLRNISRAAKSVIHIKVFVYACAVWGLLLVPLPVSFRKLVFYLRFGK